MTFTDWFRENLSDYAHDIAEHGADAGFPFITYYSDTDKVYQQYEEELWAWLAEDADDFGYSTVCEFISTFGRADLASDPMSLRCLIVWYGCERIAREVGDG